jgi:N-acetylglucosaminyl-diphospho-decaprenol L-rhamnosyltransferase
MDATVIVINYNSGDYLSQCLSALIDQDFDSFTVIVADNDSTDDSFEAAKRFIEEAPTETTKPRFRFVQNGANTGFAKGNNLAVAEAGTPLIALLNPDAIPEPDWLKTLVDAADRYPDTVMFGSTQISLNDPSRLDGVGDNYLALGVPWRGGYGLPVSFIPPECEVFSPCAAAAMYRTEAFRSVGGFDERYFCYVEDVDLGFRLRLTGGRCIQVSNAVVRHAGGASSDGNQFAIYHGTRNMIWTFVKNMPIPLFLLLLPFHIGVLVLLVFRAVLRGNGGSTLRGIYAATFGISGMWATRSQIQSHRRVPIRAILTAMCWAPWHYLRRAPFPLSDP